jgi:protein-disulfide isomerase
LQTSDITENDQAIRRISAMTKKKEARRSPAGSPAGSPAKQGSPGTTQVVKKETAPAGGGSAGGGERVSRMEQRRREKEQQQRRQRIIGIGAVVGVIALLAFVAILINTLPADAPILTGAVERYQGVPASVTEQGYVRLGDPQVARVRVAEYSSFSCPSCKQFHDSLYYDLIERVKANEITFTFIPMGNFGNPGGVDAAKAGLCVAEQDSTAFWAYHDTLFSWQGLFANQAFTLNRLRTGVENLGLNVDQYNACMGSGRTDTVLTRAETEGRSVPGFTGTPTVTVNGVQVSAFDAAAINTAIDTALAQLGGTTPPQTEPTATEESVATEEAVVTEEAAATEDASATEDAVATEDAAATAETTP